MNCKINKKDLLDSLSMVARAISANTPHPALAGIKMSAENDSLTLIGSDSNISIKSIITNTEDKDVLTVLEPGELLIEAKYILEMVRKIDSDVINIEIIDGTLIRISGGNAEFKINGMAPNDYPAINFEVMAKPFEMKTASFIKLVDQTVFACSDSDTRPVLTGVNLKAVGGKLIANATDSYRLACKSVDLEIAEEFNITVPAKNLITVCHCISGSDKLQINIDSQKMCFQSDNFSIQTRLLDDAFPDVSRLIPASFQQILQVHSRDLANAIDRSSFIKSEGKNTIKLSINTAEVDITSANQFGSSYENLSVISFSGEPFEISCNGKYLQDAIKAMSTDVITISFNGELKPLIITDQNDDSIVQLISPLRTYK